MGSPLKTVGVINADVSTCIAGWLGRKPDMLPLRMTVSLGDKEAARTYNVQTVRQQSLLPTLVFTALTNSVDMEGELPEEMTAEFEAQIELDGREPIIIKDTFSGFSGGRPPAALYGPVAGRGRSAAATTLTSRCASRGSSAIRACQGGAAHGRRWRRWSWIPTPTNRAAR